MPMRTAGGVLVALLLASAAAAQTPARPDGEWWRTLDGQFTGSPAQRADIAALSRLSFVTGALAGQQIAARIVKRWLERSADRDPSVLGALFHRYQPGLEGTQVVDGVNEFYADFRNRRIRIDDAIWIVLQEIAGDDESAIADQVKSLREPSR